MRARKGWAIILLLAATTVGWLAAGSSAAWAGMDKSERTDTWEFTVPIRFIPSKTIDFDHGSTVDLHQDMGWGFGFGYNFNEHMNLDFEWSWMNANYTVKWSSADNPPGPSAEGTGSLDISVTQINFTYYFMPKTFTPYLSGGFGWSWYDTNIPQGPPQTGCYWDPWYGYVCSTFQDTKSGSGTNYGFGAGVRFEPKQSFFIRVGVNDNWQSFGSYSGSPAFLSYRFDFGWKF